MNLYLISRKDDCGYDETEAAIVAAYNPRAARRLVIGGDEKRYGDEDFWMDTKNVTCKLLAENVKVKEAGSILESYNAG